MANETKFTPGPWSQGSRNRDCVWLQGKKEPGHGMGEGFDWIDCNSEANARLIAAAPDLLEALHEGRRAIGDHHAQNDCYATGPMTGNAFRDLVECPACSFIAMYDAAIAKATGEAA